MDPVVQNPIDHSQSRISAGWLLFGISLVFFLASIVVRMLTPASQVPIADFKSLSDMAEGYVDGIGFLVFGLIGALLLHRGSRAGWAYLAPAVCYNTGLLAAMYAVHGLFIRPLPLAVQATMLMNALFLPTIAAALIFIPVLYPGGRTTRVWRILLGILTALIVLFDLLALVTPGPVNAPDFNMPNPWGVPALKPVIDVVSGITIAAFVILAIAAAVWTIWRWRKAQGEERLAYRLFLIGELIFLAMFLLDNTMQPILPIWSWLAPLIAVPAIPVATYLALLRGTKAVPTEAAASSSSGAAQSSRATPAD